MMTYLMKGKGNHDWHKPDTVVSQKYLSGGTVTNELYVKGHVPKPPKINKPKSEEQNNNQRVIYRQSQQRRPRVIIRRQQPRTIIRHYYYYR